MGAGDQVVVEYSLEPIIEYKMTAQQALAYKLCIAWLVLSRKIFPYYKHSKGLPRAGDPRECSLFRYCFKCVRETAGLIPENEYNLYVKAQLDVLRAIDIDGKHPRIEPTCLCSDKAWVRWKMWRSKYEKLVVKPNDVPIVDTDSIVKELQKTKIFLSNQFELKEEQYMMGAKDLERWISLGKVSGYYAVLSPWVKKYCKNIKIDLTVFKTNKELEDKFKELFSEN